MNNQLIEQASKEIQEMKQQRKSESQLDKLKIRHSVFSKSGPRSNVSQAISKAQSQVGTIVNNTLRAQDEVQLDVKSRMSKVSEKSFMHQRLSRSHANS